MTLNLNQKIRCFTNASDIIPPTLLQQQIEDDTTNNSNELQPQHIVYSSSFYQLATRPK